jgi:hypothetical protein
MKPYGSAASLWRDRQQICADKQNRIIRALPGLLRRPEFRWWSIDPGTDLPTVIGLVPPDFETAIGCDLVWAMSVFFLNERVGYRRWSAGAIGFLGVLIVLRPGFRPLSIGHLGALFAGLGGTVSVVAFRAARGKEKNISLFGAGILGGVIVCGLFYVLFGDEVDMPMCVGIVLIVASGLLTLIRENVRGTPLPPSVAGERHVAAALVPEAGNTVLKDEARPMGIDPRDQED